MKHVLILSAFCAALACTVVAAAGDEGMDGDLRAKVHRAADAGLHYLRSNQAEDGSWSKSVGITALALRAFLENRRGYNVSDGAFITRPVDYLLAHVNADGSISETNQNRSYNTAVAIMALQATGDPKFAETIKNAQGFLLGHQIDEEEGYDETHRYYGGIGYGGDERPDLSNLYLAVEAMHASGMPEENAAWQKALQFLNRCQNRSESNDQEWAGNDGGFTYMPGFSPNGGTGSYGGMTHAGLLSLLYAGVDKTDPRVQAAYDWIRANYTVDQNPGATDYQGLFYYYNAFAKAMAAYGESEIIDASGVAHNWRNDLGGKLLSMQDADGSWVNPYTSNWWEDNKSLVTAWAVIALNIASR